MPLQPGWEDDLNKIRAAQKNGDDPRNKIAYQRRPMPAWEKAMVIIFALSLMFILGVTAGPQVSAKIDALTGYQHETGGCVTLPDDIMRQIETGKAP